MGPVRMTLELLTLKSVPLTSASGVLTTTIALLASSPRRLSVRLDVAVT